MLARFLLLLVISVSFVEGVAPPPVAEDAENVFAIRCLTFRSGVLTTSKNWIPRPELSCHGEYCRYFSPTNVSCRIKGARVEECVHRGLKPGVTVHHDFFRCEKYTDHSDDPLPIVPWDEDPWIVKGSYSLEDHLEVDAKAYAREKKRERDQDQDQNQIQTQTHFRLFEAEESLFKYAPVMIIACLVVMVCVGVWDFFQSVDLSKIRIQLVDDDEKDENEVVEEEKKEKEWKKDEDKEKKKDDE